MLSWDLDAASQLTELVFQLQRLRPFLCVQAHVSAFWRSSSALLDCPCTCLPTDTSVQEAVICGNRNLEQALAFVHDRQSTVLKVCRK